MWADVARELGELIAVLVLSLSPERIVIGGGVGSGQRWLLPQIRRELCDALAGYVAAVDPATAERLIVPPGLGDDAGPLGSVALGLGVPPASTFRCRDPVSDRVCGRGPGTLRTVTGPFRR